MNQINKKNSFEEILRDKQHKDKANEVFLKLLAKQKSKLKDWGVIRSHTYNPVEKSNPRNEMEI